MIKGLVFIALVQDPSVEKVKDISELTIGKPIPTFIVGDQSAKVVDYSALKELQNRI